MPVAGVEMADASGERGSTDHRSGLEAAAQEAERDFLAARQAWYTQRGDPVAPRNWMEGPPIDEPESVKRVERRYLQARDAWWKVRDEWLVSWGREDSQGGHGVGAATDRMPCSLPAANP